MSINYAGLLDIKSDASSVVYIYVPVPAFKLLFSQGLFYHTNLPNDFVF